MRSAPVLLLLTVLLGGCATYVNIPAQAGDVAVNDPNNPTVQEVTIAALQAVIQDQPIVGPVRVLLPEGTAEPIYQRMLGAVSEDATAEDVAGAPSLDVQSIMVRASGAQVDVLRPTDPSRPGGAKELVTVFLEWRPFVGWEAVGVRPWRASVDKLLMPKTTEPEPVAP